MDGTAKAVPSIFVKRPVFGRREPPEASPGRDASQAAPSRKKHRFLVNLPSFSRS